MNIRQVVSFLLAYTTALHLESGVTTMVPLNFGTVN